MFDCKAGFNDTTKSDDYFSARSDDSHTDLQQEIAEHKKRDADECNSDAINLNVNLNENDGLAQIDDASKTNNQTNCLKQQQVASALNSDEVCGFDGFSSTAAQSVGDSIGMTSKSSEDSAFERLVLVREQ